MNTRHVIQPHSIRSFVARENGSIRCLEGHCWLTRTGDPRDYLLTAGDEVAMAPNETLLLEALSAAAIETSATLTPRFANLASRVANTLVLARQRASAWLTTSGVRGRRRVNHSSIR